VSVEIGAFGVVDRLGGDVHAHHGMAARRQGEGMPPSTKSTSRAVASADPTRRQNSSGSSVKKWAYQSAGTWSVMVVS
jgi:hypothetical protein